MNTTISGKMQYLNDIEIIQFNNNTYEAMLEAIQLTKEDKFNEFTALQWGQLLKALVWVKPTNAGGYTFAQFFSYVHEMGLEKSIELYNKK